MNGGVLALIRGTMKTKIALTVVALGAIAAALGTLASNGKPSSSSGPSSVPPATLSQGGIDLPDPTTPAPGNRTAARGAAPRLFGVPTTAVSYQHCVDRFSANPT